MTSLEILFLVLAVAFAAGFVALFLGRSGLKADATEARLLAAESQKAAEERLRDAAAAETRLAAVQESLAAALSERGAAQDAREEALRAQQQAEKQAALAAQELAAAKAQMSDWEATKAQMLEATKAALLASGQTMSSKLLEDHKREAEAQKKESAELVKKTTEELQGHVGKLNESVSALHGQVQQTTGRTETILRALSNPAGAGHYAEIGLENSLREFGLMAGRDFIIQHTIDGNEDGARLRPDAVVFLPGNTVLTIDSKASKFLLEAAESEGTEREAETYAALARTMNQHLKALASKDYATALQQTYRKAGKGERIARAINIMYLPTEGGIERLGRADPAFQKKAVQENIVVCGPTGLMSYIGFARIEVDLGKQAENQEKIIAAARNLIEAVGLVIGHVAGVGKGIKAAAESHAKLVGSINSRLLPRQRTLANLGVRQAKQKDLPGALPSLQIVMQDDGHLIEGESEEIEQAPALFDERS
ncbi:MAG TPA: DNA recombination protein RmuC [Alphaproteobacteria bacterium]|nr:DNA recombination protein RmuC [Alphaproteobacteria bacterium]